MYVNMYDVIDVLGIRLGGFFQCRQSQEVIEDFSQHFAPICIPSVCWSFPFDSLGCTVSPQRSLLGSNGPNRYFGMITDPSYSFLLYLVFLKGFLGKCSLGVLTPSLFARSFDLYQKHCFLETHTLVNSKETLKQVFINLFQKSPLQNSDPVPKMNKHT